MRLLAPLAAVSAFVIAACSTSNDISMAERCPAGWTSDASAGCQPLAATVDALKTGVLGFVRVTTGICGLCSDNCSCSQRFLAEHEVEVFVDSGIEDLCGHEGLPIQPLARTTTDASGRFAFKLADGDYLLVTADPEEDGACGTARYPVSVANGGVTVQPIRFDHGVW